MCVEMVIICKKSLDKKSSDHVNSRSSSLGPIPAQTMMSQGTALFPCGLMEATRWRLVPSVQPEAGLDALWDSRPLQPGPGHCSSLSSLLRDLNLSSSADSTAPPNKRQCRSYSSSDDLSRSSWRPQGSRVWTTVEKRRCHSGGSVQRPPAPTFPSMQRSSSLSLAFPETPCPPALSSSPHDPPPSPRSSRDSTPDSTPDRERRAWAGDGDYGGSGPGLARSRSQPCVSHEKKAAVKRRRPEENKQRPSLDLAKMTQKLRSFHSLSCPGIPSEHHAPSNLKNSSHAENGPLSKLYSHSTDPETKDSFCPAAGERADVTTLSTNQKEGEAFWAGRCSSYQLGGELDIEQIERN